MPASKNKSTTYLKQLIVKVNLKLLRLNKVMIAQLKFIRLKESKDAVALNHRLIGSLPIL